MTDEVSDSLVYVSLCMESSYGPHIFTRILVYQDKKVYVDRAAELKAEYDKANEADNEQVCSLLATLAKFCWHGCVFCALLWWL